MSKSTDQKALLLDMAKRRRWKVYEYTVRTEGGRRILKAQGTGFYRPGTTLHFQSRRTSRRTITPYVVIDRRLIYVPPRRNKNRS